MITQDQLRNLVGTTAYDRDGDKLGRIGQVYYDDETTEPKWITVHTGLFGTKENFVPVQGAEAGSDRVTVAYDKATIKDAPNIDEDGHLSVEEEERLYRHYGLDYGGTGHRTGTERTGTDRTDRTDRDRTDRTDTVGHDTSGPTTDNAMTRSEEQLRVGTESQEAGRARLRKHVVTEHQQVQVPVSHEELRVEREPITEANAGAAMDGPAISEEEHEVTLHAERPVVDKEAVPVERVRVDTETVRDTETVGGEVRKEEIEVDDAGTTGRRRS
ncbi:DUF2382 domain-containing protein [Pseudonocardia broussonetiae]|uniref:PRC and DUF2382 domain-containing protein n=1 Tax=Pseudonocardia broussonetiae TaxID=2736640 RepID=A0A6M6JCA0_9PSEU|nr:PRC and DUF2382 domain-containing protein [Pseudonocardia broussonetiae]QJY44567.1 PRC and DUF2382 domain-containing protein [Pseudonocardia broussonetiae]